MQGTQGFNIGDIVRCITDNYPYFTCGKEYDVELVNAKGRKGESMTFRYNTLEEALPNVKFVVECNSFEQLQLWKKYKDEVNWEENLCGFMPKVGELCGRPIHLEIHFAKIHGKTVMFYEACSQLVDYLQVDDWLIKNAYPHCGYNENSGGCHPRTNAMNFHICVHKMKED